MNHLRLLLRNTLIVSLILMGNMGLMQAQNLKRQVRLGVQPTDLTENQASSLGLPNAEGIYIQSILPESSAEEIGLQAEDVILMINDFDVASLEDLKTSLQPLREGDNIKMGIWRSGSKKLLKGTLKGKPKESSPHGEIIYDEVAFEDGYLRALVNKPKSEKEKLPAILLIPGYPCASVDGLPEWHPYKQLVEAFAERGYVVMRIEKTGLGDCMDTPFCDEIEIDVEAAGFAAGYAHLKTYDFVDTSNIFIMGHSLGGLEAPILAANPEINPKGVMVYGTVLSSWGEYLAKMFRFQMVRLGQDYVEMEANQRHFMPILYEMYHNGTPPGDVAATESVYDTLLRREFQWDGGNMIFGRDYTFWKSVHDLDLAKLWSQTDSYVLAMYGEADIEAISPAEHEEIIRLVNAYHPDRATYQFVPKTSHSFIEVGSMQEGIEIQQNPPLMFQYYQTKFNVQMVEEMVKWMNDKLEKEL